MIVLARRSSRPHVLRGHALNKEAWDLLAALVENNVIEKDLETLATKPLYPRAEPLLLCKDDGMQWLLSIQKFSVFGLCMGTCFLHGGWRRVLGSHLDTKGWAQNVFSDASGQSSLVREEKTKNIGVCKILVGLPWKTSHQQIQITILGGR